MLHQRHKYQYRYVICVSGYTFVKLMGECQDTVEILKYPHTVFDDSSKIRSMRYILQNIDL